MMKKYFWKWHTKKEQLDKTKGSALFHEREVWWCALGVNVGYEQDGGQEDFERPVVILKNLISTRALLCRLPPD